MSTLSSHLNSILIEGNLADDPVFWKTKKGTSLCTFSIATNRFFRQDSGFEKEVSFLNVQTWGKVAEDCQKLGCKGRGVRVVGRLKSEQGKGIVGKSHYKVVIVAEHVEFRPETKRK
jgi:single-strand DNA-binding protein